MKAAFTKTLMLGLGKMTQCLVSKHDDQGLDPGVRVKSQACDPSAMPGRQRPKGPGPVRPNCLLLRGN